jgi:site-specific DNA recombinase
VSATPTRFAFYGRLSTDDRQDVTLARPSQLEACQRKVGELGGEILAEFFDQESGARDDRPDWTALTVEARDRTNRRFDAVVCYQTSRLSRNRVSAGLFERDLRKHGVALHYVLGAGDPSTAEGMLTIALQQAFDEYERAKLKRETKRGMRQNTLNGYRNGGRAPYGYKLEQASHPVAIRAHAGETKSRLVLDPEQAPVIAEIFHLWAVKDWGCTKIANHLNRPGGPPSPSHVDTKRNVRGHWAKSTIRAILKNPTYLGRLTWDRLDFATKREVGGTPRLRSESDWTVSEPTHPALVSDEMFAAAHERFRHNPRSKGLPRAGGHTYLFTGMVKCTSGHAPLAMHGRQRVKGEKTYTYVTCDYGRTYGREAAEQIDGHGQWLSLREDVLLPLVKRFFQQRIFGPMRMQKLARQLDAHGKRSNKQTRDTQTRMRRQVADLDHAIGLQIEAIEKGVEPELVAQRITQLRDEKEQIETALRELQSAIPADHTGLTASLERLPDLSRQLRDATPEVKRALFDAFELRIIYDKTQNRIQISATITETVADMLQNAKDLPTEALAVPQRDIAGAGFEPATFGL